MAGPKIGYYWNIKRGSTKSTNLSELMADEVARWHCKDVVQLFQRVATSVGDEKEHQDEDEQVHSAAHNHR